MSIRKLLVTTAAAAALAAPAFGAAALAFEGCLESRTGAEDTNAPTILGERGMQVTPLTPEEKAAFREKAQPAVRAWVVEQIGPEWPDELDAAIAAYREQG